MTFFLLFCFLFLPFFLFVYQSIVRLLDRIGFAIAQRFAAEGAKVVISSRKPDNVSKALDKLKAKGFTNVVGVKCHVGQPDDRKKLLETALENYGTIDILVSNAAVNPAFGPILDCPEDAWDKIFDVNVKASFLLAKDVAPILKEKSSGNIIFVSSIAGLSPFPVSTKIHSHVRSNIHLPLQTQQRSSQS